MNMRYYDTYESPQGRMLLVAAEDGISGLYFDGKTRNLTGTLRCP